MSKDGCQNACEKSEGKYYNNGKLIMHRICFIYLALLHQELSRGFVLSKLVLDDDLVGGAVGWSALVDGQARVGSIEGGTDLAGLADDHGVLEPGDLAALVQGLEYSEELGRFVALLRLLGNETTLSRANEFLLKLSNLQASRVFWIATTRNWRQL